MESKLCFTAFYYEYISMWNTDKKAPSGSNTFVIEKNTFDFIGYKDIHYSMNEVWLIRWISKQMDRQTYAQSICVFGYIYDFFVCHRLQLRTEVHCEASP